VQYSLTVALEPRNRRTVTMPTLCTLKGISVETLFQAILMLMGSALASVIAEDAWQFAKQHITDLMHG
jgi:hypothetical protein